MVLTRVFGVRGMKVVERRKPPPGNGIGERSVRREYSEEGGIPWEVERLGV